MQSKHIRRQHEGNTGLRKARHSKEVPRHCHPVCDSAWNTECIGYTEVILKPQHITRCKIILKITTYCKLFYTYLQAQFFENFAEVGFQEYYVGTNVSRLEVVFYEFVTMGRYTHMIRIMFML